MSNPVHYAYTILYVEDVAKAMSFYKTVFGFEQRMITPAGDYGELNTGSTTLSFASLELGRTNFKNGFIESNPKNKPFGLELAFTTDDVEDLMQKAIAEGGRELAKATQKPWGQTVGYIQDPNGFLIEICTPMATGN